MQQKIYTLAGIRIMEILKDMQDSQILNEIQCSCEVLEVEEERVVFEIHNELKVLIERYYPKIKASRHLISCELNPAKPDFWKIDIQANEVESFFFARLLSLILTAIKKDKKKRMSLIDFNLKTIRWYINATILDANKDPAKCKIAARYRKKKREYFAFINMHGSKIEVSDIDVDKLTRTISFYLSPGKTAKMNE